MVEILRELEVCQNCLIAIANADYSGMDEEEAFAVKDGICGLEREGKAVTDRTRNQLVAGGEELGFSHSRCECCGGLAGDRFTASLLSA